VLDAQKRFLEMFVRLQRSGDALRQMKTVVDQAAGAKKQLDAARTEAAEIRRQPQALVRFIADWEETLMSAPLRLVTPGNETRSVACAHPSNEPYAKRRPQQACSLRDELLNGEIFYTLREAQIVIESWRRHYNTVRPHTSLRYKPPAPEVFVPSFVAWPATLQRSALPAALATKPTLN
jgi:hypothetical protein